MEGKENLDEGVRSKAAGIPNRRTELPPKRESATPAMSKTALPPRREPSRGSLPSSRDQRRENKIKPDQPKPRKAGRVIVLALLLIGAMVGGYVFWKSAGDGRNGSFGLGFPDSVEAEKAQSLVAADVLIVGDSISMAYWTPLKNSLSETPVKIRHIGENGTNTTNGVKKIRGWVMDRPDVVVFNFGLHDLALTSGKNRVPVDQYLSNLGTILENIQASGAKPVWVTTTPIKTQAGRNIGDVRKYNMAAERFMRSRGVEVANTYKVMSSRLDLSRDGTHFTPEGSQLIAKTVGAELRRILSKR
jgi:lysophospholipase L1-like esterase